jgi:hypothetical protein
LLISHKSNVNLDYRRNREVQFKGNYGLKFFSLLKEPYKVLLSLFAMLAYVKDFIDGNSSVIDMPL